MLNQFHFLQPLWLLSLIPLALLIWRIKQMNTTDNPWSRIIDSRLRPLLLVGQDQKFNHSLLWILGMGWLLATIALANPSWEKQPQPLYQTSTARVIVLDLSRSMFDKDLKPSRLARARFKIEDILARNDEGQTGLVVFAGDAFTVTPLTRDVDTISAMLKSLDPDLMPVQGSRADLGLLKAGELLKQAGLSSGQIILLADGVTANKASKAASQLYKEGYRVSVLGVGSSHAEPLSNAKGQLFHTSDRKVILPELETAALKEVASAGGGIYRTFNSSDNDIQNLLSSQSPVSAQKAIDGEMQAQNWKARGPWLVLLLLPLAALAFRRGWMLSIVLLIGTLTPPQPAMASWDDLWQRSDQQSARAFAENDFERASQLADDPVQRGSAEYRQKNYAKALEEFSQASGANAEYNKGNTLAKLGRYQDAINAYNSALKSAPSMDDALANKASVEKLLRQQKKQNKKKKNQQGKNQQGKNQQGKNQQGKNQQGKNQQGKNQQGKNQQGKNQQGKNQQGKNQQGKNQQGKNQQGKNQQGKNQQGKNQFAEAAKALDKQKAEKKSAANEETGQRSKTDDRSKESKRPQEGSKNSQPEHQPSPQGNKKTEADLLNSEEQMAAEQWLRRIPDDPGGLLRRKFLYQYQQRAQREGTGSRQPW